MAVFIQIRVILRCGIKGLHCISSYQDLSEGVSTAFEPGYTRYRIAPDKAAYCVFTQFRGPENAIKFISVRTKTQLKSLILNSELFRSV